MRRSWLKLRVLRFAFWFCGVRRVKVFLLIEPENILTREGSLEYVSDAYDRFLFFW